MTETFERFDVGDQLEHAGVPVIRPWRDVRLDVRYSGAWVVEGDIDGDGAVEIVSARNVDEDDVHYTSAVVAHRLDGSVLWRWGDPTVGRRRIHHDVACQIHDWDGDGRNEVVVCGKDGLIVLDGGTGEERLRLPLPPEATDCLVFADLAGRGRKGEVLVKTRYGQIWAFDSAGMLLWTVEQPAGERTAHQPLVLDIDGDGRDEVLAGHALLDADGKTRWVMEPTGGHLDCARVLRRGEKPEDWRLALTLCWAECLAVIDGRGKRVWQIGGHHFESLDVGRVCPDLPGQQICVDLELKETHGNGCVWLVSEDGEPLGRIASDYCRHHELVDWLGNGCKQIVLPNARGLFDHTGRRIATFEMDEPVGKDHGEIGHTVAVGDMTGGGREDLAITSQWGAYIFRNEQGSTRPGAALGGGENFTLY